MALNELFTVASDLESLFIDKDTGLPLANGTLYFYRDAARNVPKKVYQLSGSPPNYTYTSMGSQINLSSVGTVQNASGDNEVIYWYPYMPDFGQPGVPVLDLYYIVCVDSGGTVQFTREAWPNITAGTEPTEQSDNFISNQISNPTFTNSFINPGIDNVYTVTTNVPQTFAFAPDWNFVITGTGSGSGTVTVQIISLTGVQNVPGNPPYMLDVTVSSNILNCYLTQTFSNNSGLWTSTLNAPIFLYGSFVAQNQLVGSGGIQMFYSESTVGYSPIVVVNGAFTSPYQLVTGVTPSPIPLSTNIQSGNSAFVSISLSFSPNTHVRVSAIQLIPSTISPVNIIAPDFDSSNRNQAFQGDYYLPRAAAKQINSFLVGWDFPVNPYQLGSSGSVTTTAAYITDQTIACVSTDDVAWQTDPITNGLQFTTTNEEDAFYILQYLSGDQVKDMLGNSLSVNVFGYQSAGSGAVTMRVYILSAPSTSTIPILGTSIGTLDDHGIFTPTASGWITMPRSGLPIPEVTLSDIVINSDINASANDYGFSGWQITSSSSIADTALFAIVVSFEYEATDTVFTINSISCVPGDLPCRPAIKSFDETLRQCQYYYETNYVPGELPSTSPSVASLSFVQERVFVSTGVVNAYPVLMVIYYKSVKRVVTNIITIYAQNGIVDNMSSIIYLTNNTPSSQSNIASSRWSLYGNGVYGFKLLPNDLTFSLGSLFGSAPGAYCEVAFFYIADARLGKI